jgi:uncharacterized protein with HEPN domain
MSLARLPAHLHDMRSFARELRSLLDGVAVEAFLENRVLCLAVEKLFINLGEAAFRAGDEGSRHWPSVPWRQVIGLRNILAHGYEQVAHEVLYRTVRDELPALESTLDAALSALEDAAPGS